MSEPIKNPGLLQVLENLKNLPANFQASFSRRGPADGSRRTASQTVFNNVFMHIHTVRIHRWSLKPTFTFGLGIASAASFIILAVTGIALMIYYEPSTTGAYESVKNITFVVPGGRLIRNVHRWAAYVMVVTVFLHMIRVFFTNSYKKPREFNWVLGVILFVLTLGLSFTGYCLPWDQLAYWAITIGANIAGSPVEVTDALGVTHMMDVGAMQKELMLGSKFVGGPALLRFYWAHCILLPIAMLVLILAHVWRVRKDGGLSRPSDITDEDLKGTPSEELAEEAFSEKSRKSYGLMCVVRKKTAAVDRGPERTVMSWPHLFNAEMLIFAVLLVVLLILGLLVDAPLKELANPSVPENPAKAPWYFLAMQEIISYSAFCGGMVMPGLTVLFLMGIPYLDREEGDCGRWFIGEGVKRTTIKTSIVSTIAVIGMLAFTVSFGWLRNWFPDINQIWITMVNPGTVLMTIFVLLTFGAVAKTRSTRIGVTVLFTYFLVSFVILTYFATVHRGPNWDFYWWPSLWPTH
jgi:quinol-cytochrome oxidoreductase complex cytochrome b subunit